MSRKYNYFDDDTGSVTDAVTQEDNADNSKKISDIRAALRNSRRSPGVKRDAKEVLDNALVLAKIGAKKVGGATVSAYRHIRSNDLSRRQRALFAVGLILLLIIAVVLTVVITMATINNENKREAEFNKSAVEVCLNYEETYGIAGYESLSDKGVTGYRMIGLCYAREVDFDSDKSSELLIVYNSGDEYIAEVWGFSGDDFVMFYRGSPVQTDDAKDDVWLTIYSHGSDHYICEHSRDDLTQATILALHGKKFSKKTVCTYDFSTEQYSIKGEEDKESFERIKLAVIHEHRATIMVEQVQDFLDNLAGGDRVSGGKTQAENMRSAYYDIIRDYNDRYGVAEYKTEGGTAYINGLAYVDTKDFNEDGVEELVLVYRRPVNTRKEDSRGSYIAVTVDKYFCDIYSWNGSNAWRVYQSEGISTMLNDSNQAYLMFTKNTKRPQLCMNQFDVSNYGRVINASSKRLQFDGEKFESKFRASYTKEYGYTEYYIDGQQTYKTKFTEKGGYSIPMFDGSETYDRSAYDVIYVQTDTAHSDRISNLPSQTLRNIRKINSAYQP